MACRKCGAVRGHTDDCTTRAGRRARKNRRDNVKKGVLGFGISPVCRTCDGDGMVSRHYQDRNGKWQKETTTCTDCGGSGRIDE